jgi:hypothetical protein
MARTEAQDGGGGAQPPLASAGVIVCLKAEYLPRDSPAWTALGFTSLALPGQMLEIKLVAMGS